MKLPSVDHKGGGEHMRTMCMKRWHWSLEVLKRNIMHSAKGKRGHMTANSWPCGCFHFCLSIYKLTS